MSRFFSGRLSVVAACIMVLQLGRCVYSEKVAGGEAAIFTDQQLPGFWRLMPARENRERSREDYLVITPLPPNYLSGPAAKGALLFQSIVARTGFTGARTEMLGVAYTSKLAGMNFLNISFLEKSKSLDEAPKNFLMMAYRFLAGKLLLIPFQTSEVRKAIEAGALSGKASPRRDRSSMTPETAQVQAESEEFAAYLASPAGAELFVKPSEYAIFRRYP